MPVAASVPAEWLPWASAQVALAALGTRLAETKRVDCSRLLLDAKPDPRLDPDSRAKSGKRHAVLLTGTDRVSNLVRQADRGIAANRLAGKTVGEIEYHWA
jgi:hypothetical protein